MKKLIALFLALIMMFSLMPAVFAASSEAVAAADSLYALGLFQGTGTDENGDPIYDLNRAPTRHEAVTMLVRLLGKEAEAKAGAWTMPFSDVAGWAKPCIGYAYANGLTAGTSSTTFSGTDTVTAAQYITLVLRALGYKDSEGDFTWNEAWELSDKLGLTHGEYSAANNSEFLRGDVAIISAAALKIKVKGSGQTLIETIPVRKPGYVLDNSGAIPKETGERELTDSQLKALAGLTPEKAADSISTLADAYAWLAQEAYKTHGMAGGVGGFANGTAGKELSWVEMSTVINTLVAGDYDEEGTLICVTQADPPGWDMFYISFNYVKIGGYANTVSYLLQGDYEKVGTLRWVGGGNHTISWVYTGGKYYVFDFTQYCSGGSYDNYRAKVTVLDKLEDFYAQMPDTYSFFPKSEIVIMVAFESGDAMYPSRWNDPPNFTGLTFPTEAQGMITVIYQKEPNHGVKFEALSCQIPGWNS